MQFLLNTCSEKAEAIRASEYTLPEGVTVEDKTLGLVTVIFCGYTDQKTVSDYALKDIYLNKSMYEVKVQGRYLTRPAETEYNESFKIPPFIGSEQLKFRSKNNFLRIKELDISKKLETYYVDIAHPVNDSFYYIYNYQPKELTLEAAQQKLCSLATEFPNFISRVNAYNRHGVAAFGVENEKYAFYWANPIEDKLTRIDCIRCGRLKKLGNFIAKSQDNFINFSFTRPNKIFFKPATCYSFNLVLCQALNYGLGRVKAPGLKDILRSFQPRELSRGPNP